jgi:hypothetical protein
VNRYDLCHDSGRCFEDLFLVSSLFHLSLSIFASRRGICSGVFSLLELLLVAWKFDGVKRALVLCPKIS